MSELRLSRQEDITALRQLWQQVFGDSDAYLDLFFGTAYAPQRCMVLVQEDRIAAAAYWMDCSFQGAPLAYLYAFAVSPSLQGQGLGSHLLEHIHCHLVDLGYQQILLLPGEESLRRYYGRFGYETVSYYNELTLPRGTPIPLESIDAEAYRLARRAYLENTGVLQEGGSLSLLEGCARFYRGANFLAAVDRESSLCLELLGDPSSASGIAGALGLESLKFRTPGNQIPFAMAKPLAEASLPHSIHFGFSF